MSDFIYGTPIKLKNYLPNTLRNMAKLTPKRQLVLDVEQSSIYQDEFPILSKQKDFGRLWHTFSSFVVLHIGEYKNDKIEFASDWNQFFIEIDSRQLQFEDQNSITTIPRKVMLQWEALKDRLSSIGLPYEISLFFDYLNSILSPSKQNTWEDFADTVESVLDDYIHPHILTQSTIREITADSDTQVINLTARMLGLNFRDELLNAFGKDRIAAIIPILGTTYQIANTDDFIKLVELTIGSTVLIEHLYSIDYINFKTYDQMLHKSGKMQHEESDTNDWFKTTHVNLFVEYSNAKYLSASINAKLGTTLLEVIEHFIPANLVLKNFGLSYAVNTVDNAPGFFLSSKMANRSGYRKLGTSEIQKPPIIKEKPPIEALIFDTKKELENFVSTYFEPSQETSVSNFLQFHNSTVSVEQNWEYYTDTSKNRSAIVGTTNQHNSIGLVSLATTENFEFEATLFSSSTTEKYVGLVAALKIPDESSNKLMALQFIRTPGLTNNWFANFQDGDTVSRLQNGTNAISGYSTTSGWKNVFCKIKIVRAKNIVKAYTSKFDTISNLANKKPIANSTEIIVDLNAKTNTRKLLGKQRFGYFVDRQPQASFEDIKFFGELETNVLYCLADNTKHTFGLAQKKWIVQTDYEFRDYFQAKNFFTNPITKVLYYLDGTKVLRRITPYI